MGSSGSMEIVSLPDEDRENDTRPKKVCSGGLEIPLLTS